MTFSTCSSSPAQCKTNRACVLVILAGTAFGSTLVGLTLALWMIINVRIVNTALGLRDA